MIKTFDLVSRGPAGSRQTGIKCWICYRVSWEPVHVKEKFCPTCRLVHSNDWQADPLIKLRIDTDPVFATKLLRAQKMHRIHWKLVKIGLNLARMIRRLVPAKGVKTGEL